MEVFGLLAPGDIPQPPGPGDHQGLAQSGAAEQPTENEPPSPTSSVHSSVCSEAAAGGAGGKRSRIPTFSNVTTRSGLADRTNVAQ